MSLQRARMRFAPLSVVLGGACTGRCPVRLASAFPEARRPRLRPLRWLRQRSRRITSSFAAECSTPTVKVIETIPSRAPRSRSGDRDYQFPATGQKLDTVFTDVEGRYESHEIDNVDPDGPVGARAGTQDIFIKVFTEGEQLQLLHPLTRAGVRLDQLRDQRRHRASE